MKKNVVNISLVHTLYPVDPENVSHFRLFSCGLSINPFSHDKGNFILPMIL